MYLPFHVFSTPIFIAKISRDDGRRGTKENSKIIAISSKIPDASFRLWQLALFLLCIIHLATEYLLNFIERV